MHVVRLDGEDKIEQTGNPAVDDNLRQKQERDPFLICGVDFGGFD